MNRILVFNKGFFRTTETFIHRQISGMQKCFELSLLATKEYENIGIYNHGIEKRFVIPKSKGTIDKILTSLLKRVFGISLSFSLKTYLYLIRLLRSLKTEIIHAHYGWNGLLVLAVAQRNRIPLVVSFHGNDASAALRRDGYRHRLPDLFDYAHAIIISSPHMFPSLGLDKWKSKVHLIPYGIDTKEFAPVEIKRNKEIPVKILHAGRLVGKKGVPDLIKVFIELDKKHKNLELHILGDGKELAVCKEIVANAGNQNVYFYGEQPLSTVKELMQKADIFVLNSRVDDNGDMEGLPNALLEAMSFQKAVVSTEHGGIPMAITQMEDGLLVPERDNTALQLAIETLINDAALRDRLGRNARLKIEKSFSIELMNSKLKDVFENILSRRKLAAH